MESVLLTTSDGHELAADLLAPDGPAIGGVVVCHPHPQYGGNRFNPVVDALWRTLADHGWATLRIDFRAAFDHGVGERRDVVAAVDELARRVDGPIVVAGYSFGAIVGLATVDDRIAATAAVAPPLSAMPVDPPSRPTLVLAARHDQFTPAEAASEAVAGWRDTDVHIVESADHFLVGRSALVAQTVATWISRRFATATGGPDVDRGV